MDRRVPGVLKMSVLFRSPCYGSRKNRANATLKREKQETNANYRVAYKNPRKRVLKKSLKNVYVHKVCPTPRGGRYADRRFQSGQVRVCHSPALPTPAAPRSDPQRPRTGRVSLRWCLSHSQGKAPPGPGLPPPAAPQERPRGAVSPSADGRRGLGGAGASAAGAARPPGGSSPARASGGRRLRPHGGAGGESPAPGAGGERTDGLAGRGGAAARRRSRHGQSPRLSGPAAGSAPRADAPPCPARRRFAVLARRRRRVPARRGHQDGSALPSFTCDTPPPAEPRFRHRASGFRRRVGAWGMPGRSGGERCREPFASRHRSPWPCGQSGPEWGKAVRRLNWAAVARSSRASVKAERFSLSYFLSEYSRGADGVTRKRRGASAVPARRLWGSAARAEVRRWALERTARRLCEEEISAARIWRRSESRKLLGALSDYYFCKMF